MPFLARLVGQAHRNATALSDWLRTFKIIESRDIPTAFAARKFQMQLVEARDERKYVSFRIFGDEQETRATFGLDEAATLREALNDLIEAGKSGGQL